MNRPYVYRFIDKDDNTVKYIGISEAEFPTRIRQHFKEDRFKDIDWKVEYFFTKSRTDAEAYEGDLIAKYKTYKHLNIAKRKWGRSAFLPDPEWKEWSIFDYMSISQREDALWDTLRALEEEVERLRDKCYWWDRDLKKKVEESIKKAFNEKYRKGGATSVRIEKLYNDYIESIKEDEDYEYLFLSYREYREKVGSMHYFQFNFKSGEEIYAHTWEEYRAQTAAETLEKLSQIKGGIDHE